jgi:hypothetical protein
VPSPSAWLAPIIEVLNDLEVRWSIAGGLAALRYRLAERYTADADLLTDWHPDLAQRLLSLGYAVTVLADPGEQPHLLLVRRGDERIDLLLRVVEYQDVALERATDHFLTVEDVIVHKLIAWRAKDRDDVASILASGCPLDQAYIEWWATEWEVVDRWRVATA